MVTVQNEVSLDNKEIEMVSGIIKYIKRRNNTYFNNFFVFKLIKKYIEKYIYKFFI